MNKTQTAAVEAAIAEEFRRLRGGVVEELRQLPSEQTSRELIEAAAAFERLPTLSAHINTVRLTHVPY